MLKIKIGILLLILFAAHDSFAGRHGIARDVANQVVGERFAQFYQDQAKRDLEQQNATEAEIIKAKQLELNMLKDLEQSSQDSGIKSASDLAKDIQSQLEIGGLKFQDGSNISSDNSTEQGLTNGESGSIIANKVNNEDLKTLTSLSAKEQQDSFKDVIDNIKNLPNRDKLADSFAKDLEKISPELAKNFREEYSKYTKKNKINNKKNSTIQKTKNNSIGIKDKVQIKKNITKPKTFNKVVKYHFNESQVYPIYTAANKITAILLESGERIISNPVLGDALRWQVDIKTIDTDKQQLLAIKPLKAGTQTSLLLTTNKNRMYLLDLISQKDNCMGFVSWLY